MDRLKLLLIPLLIWTIIGESKKIPCHSDCQCANTNQDFTISCQRGGLTNRRLHSLLSKLPKKATDLRIIGPWFKPNNFSMTLEFRRFKLLRELHVVNCGLRSLGTRVFSSLRYLRTLNFQRNRISSVPPETFEKTGQLEHLDLGLNDLRIGLLPTGAFSYLKRLKTLSISENKITEFPRNLLLGLRDLDSLNLDGNSLNNTALSQLLTDVPQLIHLSLNGCGIRDLTTETFQSVPHLESLEFGFNRFGRIPILPLKKLQNLRSLSLEGNNISIVPPFAFQGLSRLSKVSLAHNSLGSCYSIPQKTRKPQSKYGIDPLAFSDLRLEDLDLSYNQYSLFHSSQLGVARKTVRTLHLSGNPLNEILSEQTAGLKLDSLHISAIGLNEIPVKLPLEYYSLSILNLSSNSRIQTIPPAAASALSRNLNTLDVSNCNFSYFPKYFYRYVLDRIQTVFLQRNPFDCHCHILALKKYLLRYEQRQRCSELHLADIRCSQPKSLKDKLIVKVEKPPDCAVIFGASSGITQQSELGILIASVCGILLLIALITALVCWSRTFGAKGTYRTREDSKGHLSTSGSEASSRDSSLPVAEPSTTERLF